MGIGFGSFKTPQNRCVLHRNPATLIVAYLTMGRVSVVIKQVYTKGNRVIVL